jgi:DNA-directed RNA polymerase alpha subunit
MPDCPLCGAPGFEPSAKRPANLVTIEDLGLSVRAYNSLRRHGMTTAADLVALTYLELLEVRKLGLASAMEVVNALYRQGLALRQEQELVSEYQ